MPTVTIKGQSYEIAVNALKLMPLLGGLGLDYDDISGGAKASAAEDPGMFGRRIMQALTEPLNHYRVAFAVAQMVPDIDPSVASFRVIERNGQREQQFTLDMEAQDIISFLDQVTKNLPGSSASPQPQATQQEVAPKVKSKGFAAAVAKASNPVLNGAAARVIKPEEVKPAPESAIASQPISQTEEEAGAAGGAIAPGGQAWADFLATLTPEQRQALVDSGVPLS